MDKILFIVISITCIATALFFGDVLYVGIWYYIAVPVVAYIVALPFKPKKYFFTGIALVIFFTYIPHVYYVFTTPRPDGFHGLIHVFSLPGLALGVILAGLYTKHTTRTAVVIFPMVFVFSSLGFLLNQLIVCNTILHCGNVMSFL